MSELIRWALRSRNASRAIVRLAWLRDGVDSRDSEYVLYNASLVCCSPHKVRTYLCCRLNNHVALAACIFLI